MGLVKELAEEFCAVMHPNDIELQDKLFAELMEGKGPSMEEMSTIIKSKRPQPEDCPPFDDDYEKILEWAKASVEYSDVFVNSKGEKRPAGKYAHWTLIWDRGFIGFGINKREDEKMARKASALFIFLWCKKIPCDIASSCAELYARNVNVG